MFAFNYPSLCSAPCNANDLWTAANGFPPAMGGTFNVAGHVVGGSTLRLSGRVGKNSAPFAGAMLLEPMTAEIHLAVAPHGQLDPALLPGMIKLPIGNPAYWWLAIFD